MPWKRSAGMGKQDHGAVVGRVLRPGAVLCVQAEAGHGDEMRGGRP
jgi:hypothetical protein